MSEAESSLRYQLSQDGGSVSLTQNPRHAAAAAPLPSCVVATDGHRARAPLPQPLALALALSRPAARQSGSFDRPWSTSRAEIVRLRGVPITRDAGELPSDCRSS